jgi:acetyl esterase
MNVGFNHLSRIGRLHPGAKPSRQGVRRIRDIAYRPGGSKAHLLDVYQPVEAGGPLPVVIYIHGGGFQALSKDTHWVMGLAFARRGYLVFNINYRLAPRHRFPSAMEDACAAFEWVVGNAHRWGGDVSRLALAGESAGANLVTALAVALCYERPEPWSRAARATGIRPQVVLACCGIHQVSDADRFARRKPLHSFIADILGDVERSYLPREAPDSPGGLELADPLLLLERGEEPVHPLPAFHLPVGTADPLLDDTRRLAAALDRLGVPCEAAYYEGKPHAFHAVVLGSSAKRCWRDMLGFLEAHLPEL